jgi:hypothetical protein
MFGRETPVIIKGYWGYIDSYEISNEGRQAPICNITLRDIRDPRISIVMEGIRLDEVYQNPKP